MTFSCIKFRRKFRIKFNLNASSEANNSECNNNDDVSITSIVSKNKALLVSNEVSSKPYFQNQTNFQQKYNEDKKFGRLKNHSNIVKNDDLQTNDKNKKPINDVEEKNVKKIYLNDSELYDTINMENKIKEHFYCPLNFSDTMTESNPIDNETYEANAIESKINGNGNETENFTNTDSSYMNLNKSSRDTSFYVNPKKYFERGSLYCDHYENEEYDEIDYQISQSIRKINDKASVDSDYSTNGYNFDTFSSTTVYNLGSSTSF
jgi:hypothetical protein